MALPKKLERTLTHQQNPLAVVAEVVEAAAHEAEEADVAKENVSAQNTMMSIAPLQMMNIWPLLLKQTHPYI
jgi:hypothetical protein